MKGRAICEGGTGLPPSADMRGRLLGERRVGSLEGRRSECAMDFWVGILVVEADILGSEGRRGLSLLVKLFVDDILEDGALVEMEEMGTKDSEGKVGEVKGLGEPGLTIVPERARSGARDVMATYISVEEPGWKSASLKD